MSTIIGTLAQQNLYLQSIGQFQTQASTLESEVATGVKSTQLSGLGATAGQLTDLQSEISQNQSYINTVTTVQQNVQESTTALSSIENIASNLASGLQQSAYATPPTIQSTASQLLQEISDLLNQQGANGYIFSGSQTGTAPFDASGLPNPGTLTAAVSGAPPSGYYAGNDTAAQAQVDTNLNITYGVTADNPAIENVVRVLNFLANLPAGSPSSSNPADEANVTQAQDLLNQGVSGLQQIIANQSGQTAELNQVQQEHQNAINLAQQSLGTAENVDPATVITQLNTLETNMQASYTAISDLQKLSLVNYLSTPVG